MKHTDAQCTRIPAIFYEFDDDDSHIINSLLEILLAVSKQALDKNASRWEETNEYQVRDSAHGSIIPVRKESGTNELWYTIPYHLQSSNTRSTSMVFHVLSGKKRGKKNKNEEGFKNISKE